MSEPDDIELGASGRCRIAVIGIDRYAVWPRLSNAMNDARGALAQFGRLGFEPVAELFDSAATGHAIQGLVTDDLKMLGPEDSLILFYAGHGGTQTARLGTQAIKTGYLIPADATDKVATWIELTPWLSAVARLPAKHVLVILDACNSGIALGPIIKWRDIGTWQDAPLSTLSARRSRRIITSALDDQVALDSGPVDGHSLFTGCLIEGLTHGLAGGGSRVTTGSELGLYVQRRVVTYPTSRQTPDFGALEFDDRGELVISLVPGQAPDLAAEPRPPAPAPAPAPSVAPAPMRRTAGSPSRLERQLASVLSEIYASEQAIVNGVCAAGLTPAEVVRFPRPLETWEALIAAQRGSEVLRAIIEGARKHSPGVDWSAFDPLLADVPANELTRLALHVAWQGETETTEPFLVLPADANAGLAVRVWVSDATKPVIDVVSKLLGGRETKLRPQLTRVAGSNTWAGEAPIAASWRTRKISVTAAAGDQRCCKSLVVTSKGNQLAALACSTACLLFAVFWLWPLELTASRIAGFVPLGILAAGRLLYALKLNEPATVGFVRSFIECIERSAFITVIVALAIFAVPRYLLVEIHNDTAQLQERMPFAPDVRLDAHKSLVVPRWAITERALPSAYCACPAQAGCPCVHTRRRGLEAIELHCTPWASDLRGVTVEESWPCPERRAAVELDKYMADPDVRGRLSVRWPWPRGFHALTFATSSRCDTIKVFRNDTEVGSAKDLDVRAGASVPLLPDDGAVKLEFPDGAVLCPQHSKLLELAVEKPPASITLRSNQSTSTWSWKAARAGVTRLCVPTTTPSKQVLELSELVPGMRVPLNGLARTIELHSGELTCGAGATAIQTVKLPEDLDGVDLSSGTLVRAADSIGAVCVPFEKVSVGAATCRLDGDAIRCETPRPKCWAYADNLWKYFMSRPPCADCRKPDEEIPRRTKKACSSLCTCPSP